MKYTHIHTHTDIHIDMHTHTHTLQKSHKLLLKQRRKAYPSNTVYQIRYKLIRNSNTEAAIWERHRKPSHMNLGIESSTKYSDKSMQPTEDP